MARVVCLGAALQDIFFVDRDFGDLAALPTKIDVDKISYQVGGGGANSAVSFARHGHETILLSNIAHDAGGEAVLSLLDHENIDSSYVRFAADQQTGCSVVLTNPQNGEHKILTHRGAASKFDDFSPKCLDAIRPDWLYITTTHGDFKTLNAFCDKAHQIDCKVMFNPGVEELKHNRKLIELLAKIDILQVNREEAAQIAHGKLIDELLGQLQRHVPTVIITAGAMGGMATNGDEMIRFGLYTDCPIVDTTGAGDAFGAGFLAHYIDGFDFHDALMFASANSTAVIGQIGAHAGILSGHEILHPMPIQKISTT